MTLKGLVCARKIGSFLHKRSDFHAAILSKESAMSRPQKRFCPPQCDWDAGATTLYDSNLKTYSLLVRSHGSTQKALSLKLALSEPEQGEECSISLENIAEYRLPFMPDETKECKPPGILEHQPHLTKATLACGHGFNGMALLYHFAKNSMTCPCCRAGHAGVVMGEKSIPHHVRNAFLTHLAKVRAEDSREQLLTDSLEAARILEQEVVRFEAVLPVTRVVLILYAYESLDSTNPVLSLELPLTSSLTLNTLAFVSSGYCLRQLGINLRFMPMPVTAYELAVGVRNLMEGDIMLFKTVRFVPTSVRENRMSVTSAINPVYPRASNAAESADSSTASPGTSEVQVATGMSVEVDTASEGREFTRFEWRVERHDFAQLLVHAFSGLLETESLPEMVSEV